MNRRRKKESPREVLFLTKRFLFLHINYAGKQNYVPLKLYPIGVRM